MPAEFIRDLEETGNRAADDRLQGAVRRVRHRQERRGRAADRAGHGTADGDRHVAGVGHRPGVRSRGRRGAAGAQRRPSRCRTTPRRPLRGRIDFVYPTLDTETRTLKVRLELANPSGALKPGMFVNVELGADAADGVVVPDSAILDTGTRQLVYVETGPGRFTAREVSGGASGGREGGDPVGALRRANWWPRPPTSCSTPSRASATPRAAPRPGSSRSTDMIARIIEFSARNRLLVLLTTAAAVVAAVYVLREIRLDALPDLSDTQVIIFSRWDRSPDIIEDQVTYPITSALLGAPKVKAVRGLLRLRVLVRLRDLRGRDRPLLGPVARHRVPLEDPGAAARRRQDRTRAGRHRRRLGVPVRAGGSHAARTTRTNSARTRTGRFATRCRRFPAWRKWRPSAGS